MAVGFDPVVEPGEFADVPRAGLPGRSTVAKCQVFRGCGRCRGCGWWRRHRGSSRPENAGARVRGSGPESHKHRQLFGRRGRASASPRSGSPGVQVRAVANPARCRPGRVRCLRPAPPRRHRSPAAPRRSGAHTAPHPAGHLRHHGGTAGPSATAVTSGPRRQRCGWGPGSGRVGGGRGFRGGRRAPRPRTPAADHIPSTAASSAGQNSATPGVPSPPSPMSRSDPGKTIPSLPLAVSRWPCRSAQCAAKAS